MSSRERSVVAFVLGLIVLLVVFDIATDSRDGARWWHLAAEGSVGLAAVVGIFALMRDAFSLKRELASERQTFEAYRASAEQWRSQSKKYLDGLSAAIDSQLNQWNLTQSEKEVAFLLLKGLSSKEIAQTRNTSEKTARAQSIAIYAKAGLSGRSELAAFFLEDLLVPPVSSK